MAWSQEDIELVEYGQKNNLSLQQIAEQVGRTPAAVRVFMYRNGFSLKRKLACPLVEKLISIKFADPNWFKPNREFYNKVQIGQKRFTNLRLGYANPTEEEMRKIAKVLDISSDDLLKLFASRQLDLFSQQ